MIKEVVLFGHYDSRGGTMAIETSNRTIAEIHNYYNEKIFLWNVPGYKSLEKDALPPYNDQIPSSWDHMGTYQLYIPDDFKVDNPIDLEDHGMVLEGPGDVLEFVPGKGDDEYFVKNRVHTKSYDEGDIIARSWSDDAYGFVLHQ